VRIEDSFTPSVETQTISPTLKLRDLTISIEQTQPPLAGASFVSINNKLQP